MDATFTPEVGKLLVTLLECLGAYGDELNIVATSTMLTLSATNPLKSASCRLLLQPTFFSSYNANISRAPGTQQDEGEPLQARLRTSILKVALQKVLEGKKIRGLLLKMREPRQPGVSGDPSPGDFLSVEEDCLGSHVIMKVNGVITTTAILNVEDFVELLVPADKENAEDESMLEVDLWTLNSMRDTMWDALDRDDCQISCKFLKAEVVFEEVAGEDDLATAVRIRAEDLCEYLPRKPPMSISFRAREFAATMAVAQALEKNLKMTFTYAFKPMFFTIMSPEHEPAEWDLQGFVGTAGAIDMFNRKNTKRKKARSSNTRSLDSEVDERSREAPAGDDWLNFQQMQSKGMQGKPFQPIPPDSIAGGTEDEDEDDVELIEDYSDSEAERDA